MSENKEYVKIDDVATLVLGGCWFVAFCFLGFCVYKLFGWWGVGCLGGLMSVRSLSKLIQWINKEGK